MIVTWLRSQLLAVAAVATMMMAVVVVVVVIVECVDGASPERAGNTS